MNKLLPITLLAFTLFFFSPISTYSQRGGGGRPGGGGGMRGVPPPSQSTSSKPTSEFIIDVFPDIPDMDLTQRLNTTIILLKEQGEIDVIMQKKEKLLKKGKSVDEQKINKSIEKIQSKSNKEIKKKLPEKQYLGFLDKRSEFVFHKAPPQEPGRPGMAPRPSGGAPGGGGGRR
jgi:hypothetical protein